MFNVTLETQNGKTATRYIAVRFDKTLNLKNCNEYKLDFDGMKDKNGTTCGTILQSMTAVDDAYIVNYKSKHDYNNAVIAKYRKSDLSQSKTTAPQNNKTTFANYGHINGVTYNSETDYLYFSIFDHDDDTPEDKKYRDKYSKIARGSIFKEGAIVVRKDCPSFGDKDGKALGCSVGGIAYDIRKNKYYVSGGTLIRVFNEKTDNDMRQEKNFKRVTGDGLSDQDIGAFRGVVLAIQTQSIKEGDTLTNIINKINVYLAEYGVYIGTYTLSDTKDIVEFESITYDQFDHNFVLAAGGKTAPGEKDKAEDRIYVTNKVIPDEGKDMTKKMVDTFKRYDSTIGDIKETDTD